MVLTPLSSGEEDFVDVFDRLASKGQSTRSACVPRPAAAREQVQGPASKDASLVELADEFGLTTAGALDICDRVGIHAQGGATVVRFADAQRFRAEAARARAEPRAQVPSGPELSLRARLEGLSFEARRRRAGTL